MKKLPEMLDKPKGLTYQEFIRFLMGRNKWEDDWWNHHMVENEYLSSNSEHYPEEITEFKLSMNKAFNNWSMVERQSRILENIFLNPELVCCKNCKHNLVKTLDMDVGDDNPCTNCVFRRVHGNASLKDLNFEMKDENNRQ